MRPHAILTVFVRHVHKLHKVGVIGVPFSKGQSKSGTEKTPQVVRESNLLKTLHSTGIDVKDYGNIQYIRKQVDLENVHNWGDVTECCRILSNSVFKIIKDNRIVLVIGGDHSIGLGSINGHLRGKDPSKVAVVWVDAHADINTYKTTPSGNLHGMPLSLSVKEIRKEWPQNLPNMNWQKLFLSVKNLGYIGLRDVDPGEKDILRTYDIPSFYAPDVHRMGIKNVISEILQTIDPNRNCSLHVSFDIDALDIPFAPSTGTPVLGGLTIHDGIVILQTLLATGRLNVIDLVEINPTLGSVEEVNITVNSGKKLILGTFLKCV